MHGPRWCDRAGCRRAGCARRRLPPSSPPQVLLDSQGRGAAAQKAVELEDIKFHQCVRLAHFEKDRTISFIPPDGQFDLMTYRITGEGAREGCSGAGSAASWFVPTGST